MKSPVVVAGFLGLGVGIAIGLLVGQGREAPRARRASRQPRVEVEWKSTPERARVDHQGDRTPPESTDSKAESRKLAEGLADPSLAPLRGYSIPSGTHAVILRKEEDRPFAAFAASILPTPDQVRLLTRDGYPAYVRLQVDERLRALKALLGKDLRDAAREELRHFYEDWAYRKFLAHERWLSEIKSARVIVDPKKRQLVLNEAAKDWGMSYGRLKLEHRKRLGDTFAGPLWKKHGQRLERLAHYSEVAAALRDNKDRSK